LKSLFTHNHNIDVSPVTNLSKRPAQWPNRIASSRVTFVKIFFELTFSGGIRFDALLAFLLDKAAGGKSNDHIFGDGEGLCKELSMASVYMVEGAAKGDSMESGLRQK